ncbi:MAG: peptidylprolyl isomerase [Pseudomonadota bacterium]|nr:peptidylprolyl isomerase [Pseudomonadota bacterium]
MKPFKTFILTVIVSLLATYPDKSAHSTAQSVQRIAAIVNDELITEYDLEARIKFVMFSTRLPDRAKVRKRIRVQVLRSLIDEKLRLQETRRQNISVNQREMERAKHTIEKQNRIPRYGLDKILEARNIPLETLESRLRAVIAWSKLVRRRLKPRITVGEDEIDEVIEKVRSRQGETEYYLNEILLSIDHPTEEAGVYETALRIIKQVRAGANFSAIAQQFSKSATATAGGTVGWVHETELSRVSHKTITSTKVGDITAPIKTVGGYRILMLKDVRKVKEALRTAMTVGLRQIFLPIRKSSIESEIKAKIDLARNLNKKITSCSEIEVFAERIGSTKSPKLEKFRLDKLNPRIRSIVKKLPLGKFSQPIQMPHGILVLMVCERGGGQKKRNLPSRKLIADRLRRDRLTLMIRRYMRDIRLSAVIDIRV